MGFTFLVSPIDMEPCPPSYLGPFLPQGMSRNDCFNKHLERPIPLRLLVVNRASKTQVPGVKLVTRARTHFCFLLC